MRLLTMATNHPLGFEALCERLDDMFLAAPLVNRGEWQAQRTDAMSTRELNHVVLELPIPDTIDSAQLMVTPNLPWAEEHFQERVGGAPLNPPPSAARWPFARAGHKEHTTGGKFSHTYPERMWSRWAGDVYDLAESISVDWEPQRGVRFEYGDLGTLLDVIAKNPASRQLYLPIWFPEDIEAARLGERVPCTIGYHWLVTPDGLDCTYTIRSCDYMRHFRDDVYMAMRLTQWICEKVNRTNPRPRLVTGKLYMHIINFHTFLGDDATLEQRLITTGEPSVEIMGGE
jgi:hypothetical protein